MTAGTPQETTAFLDALVVIAESPDVLAVSPTTGTRVHMSRTARIERTTKESDVLVELDLDGTGQVEVSTGVPFC